MKNGTQTSPTGTLPASWYSTKGIHELERRAIFARQWLLITHEMRFAKPGSYAQFTVAGYPFFIIRDREGALNAFLNVCRHRAFPVVLQDEGTASILACKYHGKLSALLNLANARLTVLGWSYSLKGNLAKAPKFDTVESFDKKDYSLFRVHLKIDKRGFLWVNLDSKDIPAVKWEDSFQAVDEQPRLGVFDMSKYQYDHSWNIKGDYNWKTLIDNYNEVSTRLATFNEADTLLVLSLLCRPSWNCKDDKSKQLRCQAYTRVHRALR